MLDEKGKKKRLCKRIEEGRQVRQKRDRETGLTEKEVKVNASTSKKASLDMFANLNENQLKGSVFVFKLIGEDAMSFPCAEAKEEARRGRQRRSTITSVRVVERRDIARQRQKENMILKEDRHRKLDKENRK